MSQVKEPKTPSGVKKKTTLKSTTVQEEPVKKVAKPKTDDQIIAEEIKRELAQAKEIREEKITTLGKEFEEEEENEEGDEDKSETYPQSDLEEVETGSGRKVKRHRRDSAQAKKDRNKLKNLFDDESHVKKITDDEEAKLMLQPIDRVVVSSETNWFQIESKIRRLIHALLLPVVTRAHEDRDSLQRNEKSIGFHQTRLDNIELYLFTPADPKKVNLKPQPQPKSKIVSGANSPTKDIEKPETKNTENYLRNSNNSGIEIGIEESPELAFKEEPNEMEIVDELPKNFTKLDEIDLKLDKIKMSVLSHQQTQVEIDKHIENQLKDVNFHVQQLNQKVGILKSQQAHVDVSFEKNQKFMESSLTSMTAEILDFKKKVAIDFEAVKKVTEDSSFTVTNLKMQQKDFYEKQIQFADQLLARKSECDTLSSLFHEVKKDTVKVWEFKSSHAALEAAVSKMATENIAQQFEINTMSNFQDKYLPLRVQHQISAVLRPVLYKAMDFQEAYGIFEETEGDMFNEFHQILLMDTGRADVADTIEKMNLNIAKAQKIGKGPSCDKKAQDKQQDEIKTKLKQNNLKATVPNDKEFEKKLKRVDVMQEREGLNKMTEVPRVDIDSLPMGKDKSPKRVIGSQGQSRQQLKSFDNVDARNKNPTSQTFGNGQGDKKSIQRDSELQRIHTEKNLKNDNLKTSIDNELENITNAPSNLLGGGALSQNYQNAGQISQAQLVNENCESEFIHDHDRASSQKGSVLIQAVQKDQKQKKENAAKSAIESHKHSSQNSPSVRGPIGANKSKKDFQIILKSEVSDIHSGFNPSSQQKQMRDPQSPDTDDKDKAICLGDMGKVHVHVKDHHGHMHVEQEPIEENDDADEAALAADIQKLMNPNKEKHEKLQLNLRFEEVNDLIKSTRSDLEHSVTVDLIKNRSDIEVQQKTMMNKFVAENAELRSFLQSLHNEIENVGVKYFHRIKQQDHQIAQLDNYIMRQQNQGEYIKHLTFIANNLLEFNKAMIHQIKEPNTTTDSMSKGDCIEGPMEITSLSNLDKHINQKSSDHFGKNSRQGRLNMQSNMMSKRLKPINMSTSFIKLNEPNSAAKVPSLNVFKATKIGQNFIGQNTQPQTTGFVTERSLQQASAAAHGQVQNSARSSVKMNIDMINQINQNYIMSPDQHVNLSSGHLTSRSFMSQNKVIIDKNQPRNIKTQHQSMRQKPQQMTHITDAVIAQSSQTAQFPNQDLNVPQTLEHANQALSSQASNYRDYTPQNMNIDKITTPRLNDAISINNRNGQFGNLGDLQAQTLPTQIESLHGIVESRESISPAQSSSMIHNSQQNNNKNGVSDEVQKMENITFNSTTVVNMTKNQPQNIYQSAQIPDNSEHNSNHKVFSALNQQHGQLTLDHRNQKLGATMSKFPKTKKSTSYINTTTHKKSTHGDFQTQTSLAPTQDQSINKVANLNYLFQILNNCKDSQHQLYMLSQKGDQLASALSQIQMSKIQISDLSELHHTDNKQFANYSLTKGTKPNLQKRAVMKNRVPNIEQQVAESAVNISGRWPIDSGSAGGASLMNSFDEKLFKQHTNSAESSFSGQQLYKTSRNLNLVSDSVGNGDRDQFMTLDIQAAAIDAASKPVTPLKSKEPKISGFPDLTEINELNEKIDNTNQEDNLTQPTQNVLPTNPTALTQRKVDQHQTSKEITVMGSNLK